MLEVAKEKRTKKNKATNVDKKVVVVETKKVVVKTAHAKAIKKIEAPKQAEFTVELVAPIIKSAAPKKNAKPVEVKGKKIKDNNIEAAKRKLITSNVKQETITKLRTIIFNLKFTTSFGQALFITGNHDLLGNRNIAKALPMQYFNDEFWYANIDLNGVEMKDQNITYNYFLKSLDGTIQYDCGNDKQFNLSKIKTEELLILDGWNYTGYVENAFYTVPFQNVLLKENRSEITASIPKKYTHIFQTKTPLLSKDQTLCFVGSSKKLNSWDTSNPILMHRSANEAHYKAFVDLSKEDFPIAYKYGVYDTIKKEFIRFEDGNNRVVYDAIKHNKLTIVNDAFANLPSSTWKGAGVAIPVFSLKTENSFGVGEFNDIRALADWSHQVGLKLIQILPINDTTATYTWQDSYPYAAISAFALNPIYINLEKATDTINKYLLKRLNEKQAKLNAKDAVDYEEVLKTKTSFLKKLFPLQDKKTFASEDFKIFFNNNKHWLVSYAVFCYLRDEYKTANYNEWPAYRQYNEKDIEALINEKSAAYHDICFHYFIQYHLHIQLLEATTYAHSKGIVVKGDIAIGIFRYGADAWQHSHLFNMNLQAGAPPDDFAMKGQNWGFPTYNWQQMQQDDFAWWRQRFEQMSYYFDAFRIDHILGFFRIWSIPMDAVEGILGHFVPAIPVHINELFSRGIDFNHQRFTKPFITEHTLWEQFGYDKDYVKEVFVEAAGSDNYKLRKGFTTQREVEKHFATLEQNNLHEKLKIGLYNLISNVILFDVENTNGQQFHFRFGMEQTESFQNLDYNSQHQLKELYVDYFFRRQDDFWQKEAMQKLPALRRVTNMLICGEDLGLVPACVPDVMKQLGLLSLEIQRMPKDNTREFFHPNAAPYLSVVTPSTHDMSIIRGWWEEDVAKTQKFYNQDLGQLGVAPFFCEGWINKAIVVQHLYSPAMWAIFQLQDLLGMDENLRRENPNDERINVPSNPKHYWQYRMNMSLEDLMNANNFNTMLKEIVVLSGR
jgi:4-alpha-glucanotransferase